MTKITTDEFKRLITDVFGKPVDNVDVVELLQNYGFEQDLTRICWTDITLRNANFKGINFNQIDFSNADLRGSDFTEADMSKTYLKYAQTSGCKFPPNVYTFGVNDNVS